MIGDGITDLEAVQETGGADMFVGFGGRCTSQLSAVSCVGMGIVWARYCSGVISLELSSLAGPRLPLLALGCPRLPAHKCWRYTQRSTAELGVDVDGGCGLALSLPLTAWPVSVDPIDCLQV